MASASNVKFDLTDLVSALQKFLAWQDEQSEISELRPAFGADNAGLLMDILGIPSSEVSFLIGGSNAPIFHKAADEINRLRKALREVLMIDVIKANGMSDDVAENTARRRIARKAIEDCPNLRVTP